MERPSGLLFQYVAFVPFCPIMRRPVATWVLVMALLLVGAGTWFAGVQVRNGMQERVHDGAVLTAETIITVTVGRNFADGVGLRPGTRITAPNEADIQADVDGLTKDNVLRGLEVWRPDGSLVFADSNHPTVETQMPRAELDRALAGGFVQDVTDSARGGRTLEVFRRYDQNGDGTADAIVEVVLPANGQAHLEMLTKRLYLVLGLLALLIAAGLVNFNRRLGQREHEARHDPLTGLGNRHALHLRGDSMLVAQHQPSALVLLDLDGFKAVNDTLGHHAGDELLVQVAHGLTSLVRPADLVVRLGGDEFAVLFDLDGETALRTAQRLVTGLAEQEFSVDGVQLDVQASAGVAQYPQDAAEVEGLLQRADVAMYQAKSNGAGAVLYDATQDDHDVSKLQLLAQLRRAIDVDELVLHYQPKADLGTGHVASVEALVRWQHPERGLLPPDTFIPIAEYTALMKPLTVWVLEKACRQAAAWRDARLPLAVAVNVSPRVLVNGDLPDIVERILTATGLPAALLELEVTETAVVVDPDAARTVLERLRDMGVRVSLDDFGTGYTSMALLQTLPVTSLKIDRGFVTGMLAGDEDAVVAESLITLAHRLGLNVVAEGVETLAVWDRLRALGCDQAQGFYLAYPMPADQVELWALSRDAALDENQPITLLT
jgi:diguanylate cyclase (GGDEF)-like protein